LWVCVANTDWNPKFRPFWTGRIRLSVAGPWCRQKYGWEFQEAIRVRFAFIRRPLGFVLGVSAFAWGAGFARYFDRWVFFPAFPNILDTIGMSLVGVYLLYVSTGRSGKSAGVPNPGVTPVMSIFDDIDPKEQA